MTDVNEYHPMVNFKHGNCMQNELFILSRVYSLMEIWLHMLNLQILLYLRCQQNSSLDDLGDTMNKYTQENSFVFNESQRLVTINKPVFLDRRRMVPGRDCQSNSSTGSWTTSQKHLVTWPQAARPCKQHVLWSLWSCPLPLSEPTTT